MPLGPGKYDALCTETREKAKAKGAIVIVLDGEHGSGFSMQGTLGWTVALPELLREVAAEIEASFKKR